jgi:hypothetical protein
MHFTDIATFAEREAGSPGDPIYTIARRAKATLALVVPPSDALVKAQHRAARLEGNA